MDSKANNYRWYWWLVLLALPQATTAAGFFVVLSISDWLVDITTPLRFLLLPICFITLPALFSSVASTVVVMLLSRDSNVIENMIMVFEVVLTIFVVLVLFAIYGPLEK